MAPDRVHPDMGDVASAPPPPGAYYSVKDQPLPAPSTYRGRKRGRSACCCCFLWLLGILAILMVLVGIAVLIFWLVVQPRVPKYEVNNVRISGLQALNASTVSPETTFEVMARNPNKRIGIYYDQIKVNVQTMGLTIGNGTLPTFYQGHKNTTTLYGDLKSQPITLDQATQTKLLNAQRERKVPMDVNVDARVRIKIGSWKSRKITVRVRCDIDVDLSITTSSQIRDKRCKVKVRR